MTQKYCVIVDAISSAVFYAEELQSRGYLCIHVESNQDIPHLYRYIYRPTDFVKNIKYTGNLEETLQELKQYPIACVFSGFETSVELADQIAHGLGTLNNGLDLMSARRNKYEMVEALKRKKVKSVEHLQSNNLQEILTWAEDKWPIVLKPLESASSDGVFKCTNSTEIKDAFQYLFNNPNFVGILNEKVLAQTFLEGIEYIVNSVSCQGKHLISDIWKYSKGPANGSAFVYDTVELLPSDGNISDVLSKYIFEVLDALEIQYGPCHSEVIITPQGPILVETGARLRGTRSPKVTKECLGVSQLEISVDSYLDHPAFFKRLGKPYTIQKHGMSVHLISPFNDRRLSKKAMEEIQNLPSIFRLHLNVQPGELVSKTVDMLSSPGLIELCHKDKNRILSDFKKIREIESQYLYD